MKLFLRIFAAIVLFFFMAVISGCGGYDAIEQPTDVTEQPTDVTEQPADVTEQPAAEVYVIGLVSSVGSLYPGDTADITATAYDSSGRVFPNESLVFTLDNPILGSIEREAVTGTDGTAKVILKARANTGTIQITATGSDVPSEALVIVIEPLPDEKAPASIELDTANPEIIMVENTATVLATVLDSNSNPVAPGTSVIFTLSDSQFGTLTPETATTNAVGVATTTFKASSIVGEVEISASTGTLETTTSSKITINGSLPASIEFVSTSASIIAVAGSGGSEIATVKFIVRDSNNNPVQGQNIRFLLDGPNGGEKISDDPDLPDQLFVSTLSDGYAEVLLRSGFVAGPATITASTLDNANNPVLTVNAPVISIGGGVPSEKRLVVGVSVKNLPGLEFLGRELDLTAYMADRFGDYNILDEIVVSFITETGLAAFSTSVSANDEGKASVKIRTQGIPENVEADFYEMMLIDALNADYFTTAVDYSKNPRDGLCSVLVYTKGEEYFVDNNANGIYDSGETYEDTVADPFCDYDYSGDFTDGSGANPFEQYIDAAQNNIYDGKNEIWDDDKYIFRNYQVLITGRPVIRFSNKSTFPNNIKFIVCDKNFNPLVAGSSISVSHNFEDAEIKGNTSHVFLDTNQPTDQLADIEYTVWLEKTTSGTSGTIDVTVTWEGEEYKSSISGMIP